MDDQSSPESEKVDLDATVRISRRQTVLAQIEAALLADKLSVVEVKDDQGTGTDPYNSVRKPSSPWRPGKR